ncbi:MAG: thiamine phosphate synthase [Gemmatimonadota bacterium]
MRRLDRSRPTLCFVHDASPGARPDRLWAVEDDDWRRIDLVQVRGKTLSAGELEALTRGWIERLAGLPPKVLVNDRLDVALASGAHGAHLGRDDVPLEVARRLAPTGFFLGGSTHDRDELRAAQEAGADYAGLGAFFVTPTKESAMPLDFERGGLKDPLEDLAIPVLAIGGITAERVGQAFQVPVVTGVAVSAAIQDAPEPGRALRELAAAVARAWETHRRAPGAPSQRTSESGT